MSQCGEQAGDLLMQLSLACERGDTQAAAATAKQLPTLVDKMPNELSSEFGESEVLFCVLSYGISRSLIPCT